MYYAFLNVINVEGGKRKARLVFKVVLQIPVSRLITVILPAHQYLLLLSVI